MGMTMAEKVLARASGKKEVRVGEYVTAKIDMIMTHEGFANISRALEEAGITRVADLDKIVVLLDHQVPPASLAGAETHKRIRDAVRKFGIKHWHDWNTGI